MVAISEAETPIGKQRRKVEIQEALESHLGSNSGFTYGMCDLGQLSGDSAPDLQTEIMPNSEVCLLLAPLLSSLLYI